jgi:hypothetical protein
MGCTTNFELEGIGLDCNDIPTGGIKSIYIANAQDTVLGFVDKPIKQDGTTPNTEYGKVTCLAFRDNGGTGEVFKLDFNRKDGATGWSEAKTVDNTGLITSVPTLTIELPKMTKEKRNMINEVLNPNANVLLFVETAAGTHHVLGAKYGMRATSGSGATGTGRTEKNAYTLVFTGEESELSYDLADKWSNVVNKVTPTLAGEGDWEADIIANESTVPRQGIIPTPV